MDSKKTFLKATGQQIKHVKNFPLENIFLECPFNLKSTDPIKKGHQDSPLLEAIHNYFQVHLCLEKHFSRPDTTGVHGFALARPK